MVAQLGNGPGGKRLAFFTSTKEVKLMTFRAMNWMLAAVMVGGVACNREEPTPAPETTSSATQPAEQHDDAWITTSLQGRFYADDAVRGRNVNVSTDNGVVTLRGTVDSETARTRAVALAREVDGVVDVQDQLRVDTAMAATDPDRPRTAEDQPTGTSGAIDATQPAWITTKIQAQYFINPEIKPWNIDVTTANNGVVTLEGEVDSADDKAEAVRIARSTEGVARVEDRLRVRSEAAPATPDTAAIERPDVWLTAKVQSKYFLDDEVKGRDIDVTTSNGVVTLTGRVDNEAERRQALALARTTEGVKEVVDRLEIGAGEADTARGPAEKERIDPVSDLSRPDEWITMKIQSKYFLDSDVKGHEINVDTVKGVVTLKGSVASAAQKSQAEQLAKDTEGVTRIVNQLTVGGRDGR
jgi:osmotically-inducible protein OsmY